MALRAFHKVVVSDFDFLGVLKRKTADETVASSVAVQNDDELFLPVAANSSYLLDAFILYTGALDGATGGLKIGWTGPSGASFSYCVFGRAQNSTTIQYTFLAEGFGASSQPVATSGPGTLVACQPKGILSTGVNSGNLQFQFAQGGSTATGTTVKAGSWIRLVKVG